MSDSLSRGCAHVSAPRLNTHPRIHNDREYLQCPTPFLAGVHTCLRRAALSAACLDRDDVCVVVGIGYRHVRFFALT
jgi:hypothetical protein